MKVVLVLVAALAIASAGKIIKNRSGFQNIVGGSEATPHSYPWMAALLSRQSFFCGGSLIKGDTNSRYYILTAAHCVSGRRKIDIRLGDHDRFVSDGSEQDIRTQGIYTHPGYNSFTLENDVALIRLRTRRLRLTDQVQVGKLPTAAVQPDESLTVIGWGSLSEGGPSSSTLQEVVVFAQSQETCESTLSPYSYDRDTMFCAGPLAGGEDACQGDSGSPIMADRGSGLEIAGVVSWGIGCARLNRPGVYADVYSALGWINSIINN